MAVSKTWPPVAVATNPGGALNCVGAFPPPVMTGAPPFWSELRAAMAPGKGVDALLCGLMLIREILRTAGFSVLMAIGVAQQAGLMLGDGSVEALRVVLTSCRRTAMSGLSAFGAFPPPDESGGGGIPAISLALPPVARPLNTFVKHIALFATRVLMSDLVFT